MKLLKNWDNKNWLSSNSYISSFNSFLLKKKKLDKNSTILDIGCGRGKIFGSLSRKLKLINKPIGIDIVPHRDVDKSINFKNENIFNFFKKSNIKFDLIMIKQTLHLFDHKQRIKLVETCKKNLKKNGLIIIFSLNTSNNKIPSFKLMNIKLQKGLRRDSIMLSSICKKLKDHKIDKFTFKVSITKNKYIRMIKQRYISCLINMSKKQLNKGIKEIKEKYPKKFIFKDVLICITYQKKFNS